MVQKKVKIEIKNHKNMLKRQLGIILPLNILGPGPLILPPRQGAAPVFFSYRHGRHDGGTQLVEGAHLTGGDTRFCRESSKSHGFCDRGSENTVPCRK